MLKICAFILLLPLSSFAGDSCTQASCEKVFHVRENHPKMEGLEIELEDGKVMSLAEFLENISEEPKKDQVVIFGGEVPWPIDPETGKPVKPKK